MSHSETEQLCHEAEVRDLHADVLARMIAALAKVGDIEGDTMHSALHELNQVSKFLPQPASC